MSLELKPGTRLFGPACTTEMIVVKAPADAVDLRIGGHPAVTSADERDDSLTVTNSADEKPAMGKRYVDADDTIEGLCTKAGDGAPGIGDTLLVQKDAKPLPASD
jgi:hypothetical protein